MHGEPLLMINVLERKFIIYGMVSWRQDFFIFGIAMLTFVVFVILFTVERMPRRWRIQNMAPKLEPVKHRDCIDCRACVRVCPTGIDIRNGAQLECVNCIKHFAVIACGPVSKAVAISMQG
jgi:polyferredoxin